MKQDPNDLSPRKAAAGIWCPGPYEGGTGTNEGVQPPDVIGYTHNTARYGRRVMCVSFYSWLHAFLGCWGM